MAKKTNPDFVEEFCVKPVFDADGVQATSGIGIDGKEYPDPVPAAPPVGYTDPPDLMTTIRRMVHNEFFNAAVNNLDVETFEEAEDFELEDDPDFPLTDYERVFDPTDKQPPGPQAPGSPPAVPSPPVQPQGGVGAAAPSPTAPPVAQPPAPSGQHRTHT